MDKPLAKYGKYKTSLCKHYETSKGCVLKDKCKFAHGTAELRYPLLYGVQPQVVNGEVISTISKPGPGSQNYKVSKCKYWDLTGACKNGNLCSYAHGEHELRTKSDNLLFAQKAKKNNTDVANTIPAKQVDEQAYSDQTAQSMMNPYLFGYNPNDPNSILALQNMMGEYAQGFDPSLLNMYMNMTQVQTVNFPSTSEEGNFFSQTK